MKTTTLILGVISVVAPAVLSIERPELYDYSLPFPESTPEFVTASKLPYFPYELLISMILDIDENGKVKEINTENGAPGAFATYVADYLSGIEFEPAEFGSKEVSSRLPVLVQFRPRVYTPDFYFPISEDLSIKDRDLYFRAIELNEIELPRVIHFPSFFSDLKNSDMLKVYPIILLKISLDDSGKLLDVVEDFSTFPSFNTQLKSAALYAEFSPAKVKGKAVSSEAYLLISFFPQNTYPTKDWSLSAYNEMKLIEQYQVRLMPAKVGLLSKPIPRKIPADTYPRAVMPSYLGRTVSVALTIDTSGKISLQRISKTNKDIRTGIKNLVLKAKFFPALDYRAKPQSFSGLIRFEPLDKANIRIRYDWLSSEP